MSEQRKYPHARARGYVTWNPQANTLVVLKNIEAVLKLNADHLPLTIRQIFYRLVAAFGYAKSEKAYSRLSEHMVRARRSGIIDFSDIRDDGTTQRYPLGFDGPGDFWVDVKDGAEGYRQNRQGGQPNFVELWTEAMGMVPQLVRVAYPLGVPVFSSGGFSSVTAKHDAAERILQRDVHTVIFQVGDHDASGVSIFDSAAEDVLAFLEADGQRESASFQRLAVTPGQISTHNLPTAPPKRNDRRGNWTGGTVQVEALDPATLAQIVRDGIEEEMDMDVYRELLEGEALEREELIRTIKGLDL